MANFDHFSRDFKRKSTKMAGVLRKFWHHQSESVKKKPKFTEEHWYSSTPNFAQPIRSCMRNPFAKWKNGKSEKEGRNEQFFGNGLLKEILDASPYTEHHMTLEQLRDVHPLTRISCKDPTKSAGLNDDEVNSHLSQHGRNLVQPPRKSRYERVSAFFSQFLTSFRLLLLMAAAVCLLIFLLDMTRRREILMSGFLFVVLMCMCLASYWQQGNINKHIRGFQSIIPGECTVQRENREFRIQASGVARGDLIWIRVGDRVPADCRLLYTDALKLETSWISGEVEPLEYTESVADKKFSVLESQNIAFAGCSCVSGQGLGLAIRTGNNALIGKIVHYTSHEKPEASRLEKEHRRFVRFITILALSMSTITFAIGLAIKGNQHLVNTFINGFLIVLVASVPQGLPVTLTTQLIIVARRLTRFGLFLKRMDVADTLGLTSVLLTDKSGVLTSNHMKVVDLWFDGELLTVQGILANKNFEPKCLVEIPTFSNILDVMSVCDRAQIRPTAELIRSKAEISPIRPKISQESRNKPVCVPLHHTSSLHQKSIVGKSTDVALIKFVEQLTSFDKRRDAFDIVYELPFSAQRRYHLVVARKKTVGRVEEEDLAQFVLMVKGAPEELIRNCSTIRTSDGDEDLTEERVAEFDDMNNDLAASGKTCIAFAQIEFTDFYDAHFANHGDDDVPYPENGWCFLGLASMFDRPLPDVKMSVRRAKEAGIKLFMVTGDHPATAEAVAKQIGFFDDIDLQTPTSSCSDCSSDISGDSVKSLHTMHGDHLNDLTEEEWNRVLSQRHAIFARTTPTQKLLIIEHCRRLGHVVTMTGDGLMDARGLKQADTGIAIEAAGSVFAKEAADVVTANAELRTIVDAIAESRLLFDNLRKTIAYTLSHLQPELLPVLFTFILGLPLGLTSVQVLTVDLLTEIPPSVALVFEPAERDIMKRPPRRRNSRLVTGPLLGYAYVFAGNLIGIGCTMAYFSVFWFYGFSVSDILFTSEKQWLPTATNVTATLTGKVYDDRLQVMVHREACAAWQICLVMSQVFHLWMCTTRRISIFRHGFRNWAMGLAVLFEVGFLMCLMFVPALQDLVEVRPPPVFVWLFPVGVAVALLVFNELRKFLIRQNAYPRLVKLIRW